MARHEDLRPHRGDVVALGSSPARDWVATIERAWAVGAAVLPLDHRLAPEQRRALVLLARPTVLVDEDGARRLDGIPAEEGDALLVATSGTGGAPKVVRLGRGALEAAVSSSARILGATAADAWPCCLPPAHVGGLLVLLRGVLLGAPLTVHPSFDVDAVRRDDAAFTSLVPTMLARLLDAEVDLSGYRGILVGGSALEWELRERALAAGTKVIETYGLTETCGGVVYDGVPLPGSEVSIGAEAEISVRGPTLMLGYRADPAATATAIRPGGWLRTGDAGELDGEGRLRVLGRLDDLVTSGGEKVWPQEVEAALRAHPKVRAVGVAGRADPEWGQRVVAWVVPVDPADPPTLRELREHASGTLARHQAPRELVVVDELPGTAGGKLRRAGLAVDTRAQEPE